MVSGGEVEPAGDAAPIERCPSWRTVAAPATIVANAGITGPQTEFEVLEAEEVGLVEPPDAR